jgi:hypothetical protein
MLSQDLRDAAEIVEDLEVRDIRARPGGASA